MRKSSIPLDVKSKLIFNEVSQEMVLYVLNIVQYLK